MICFGPVGVTGETQPQQAAVSVPAPAPGEDPHSPLNLLLVPSVVLEEDKVLPSPAVDLEAGAARMLAQGLRCKFCFISLPFQDLRGPQLWPGVFSEGFKVTMQGQGLSLGAWGEAVGGCRALSGQGSIYPLSYFGSLGKTLAQ